MSHHQEHHRTQSHARFDEHADADHSNKPRFSGTGYSNKRFSAEGYSNERFNIDTLQQDDNLDDDEYNVLKNEIPDVDIDEDFFDDEDNASKEAPYGQAFSQDGPNKYFSHENQEHSDESFHEHLHSQFSGSNSDETPHQERSFSHRPSLAAHKHRTFSEVVPSKTLFGPAFSHSFGEIPNNFDHENHSPKSYSQNQIFDEDEQISNDYSDNQGYFDSGMVIPAPEGYYEPAPVILRESMSTQTVETKKPRKGNSVMQKCRLISDVTMNYFGECCLNRKQNRYQHEVPTRDYGAMPPYRSMSVEPLSSNYLRSMESKGKSRSSVSLPRSYPRLRSSSTPMSVKEIQNRQNLLRLCGKAPIEVHCYSPYKHDRLEGINEEDEVSFCTNEFPEVNACHNINNFNCGYKDPNGSLDSSGSVSICMGQPKALKSCLCKKQPNVCGYQRNGSLRGGGIERCKKVRLNTCPYRKPPSISGVDDADSGEYESAMQNFINERRQGNPKPCTCGSHSNLSGEISKNRNGRRSSGSGNFRRSSLKPCACGSNTNLEEVSKRLHSLDEQVNLTDGSGSKRFSHGGSDGSPDQSADGEKSRRGSLKSCACGSETSIEGFDKAYKKSHNLDNKKTSCTLCNCMGHKNDGKMEMKTNSCCSCKKSDERKSGCKLCSCGETKSKPDLFYLCQKEVTKPSSLNLRSSGSLTTGANGRSRSHGNLYCLCTPKQPATSCKNDKTASQHRSAEEIKSKRSSCTCWCHNERKKSCIGIQTGSHKNSKTKCSCGSKSTSSSSRSSTTTSDSILQKKNKKKPKVYCSCNPKHPFRIEFDDDNQVPTIKVCLFQEPQPRVGSKTKSSLVNFDELVEPINQNPDSDDMNCVYQNKINSSLVGSSGGVHQLTDPDFNSFNDNSVCTSTNFLYKDKSLQAMSRSNEKSGVESNDDLPIVFCNHKCPLFSPNLYQEPLEVHACNPFYVPPSQPMTESQLRVQCRGSDVNILYTSNLFVDSCNQTAAQDYCCSANLRSASRAERRSVGSECSGTSDSVTINEINIPVLTDQKIKVAQTKHKTKIHIVSPKSSKEKLKNEGSVIEIQLPYVGKKNKKIYCCDPVETEELPPCLEKIGPKCECFDEEKTKFCKCGKCRCRCNASGESSKKTNCRCLPENSDEVFRETGKEKRNKRLKSEGKVQPEVGTSRRKVKKSSSAELYSAFLKRAEVVILVCSVILYAFIYKVLTSYAV